MIERIHRFIRAAVVGFAAVRSYRAACRRMAKAHEYRITETQIKVIIQHDGFESWAVERVSHEQ